MPRIYLGTISFNFYGTAGEIFNQLFLPRREGDFSIMKAALNDSYQL
jgi:hypothetical protein